MPGRRSAVSEVVDTRIVEAKFDSAQFEKGVDKTVKKLDELKKSLNLEKTGESITQLAGKTKEASEKASGALDKLQHRFTDFAGMLKQKMLSGIADEIVGVVFKIKSAFEGLVHSLGSAQVSHGMQRYVDIMGSVRTMVFSGVDESVAYDTIGRLGTYADQTSYSLDQLVSTMSKFKTAGADLGTAERMVIGLSNAAASMGVNADEASRAYLNLQQAYSSGAMLQRDWLSFESLPMVGEKFNQAILDAAVKMKTLEKQSDGTYKTINKIDKQVKTSGADAKGITAQNLGTKLSSRWFNKSVMEEVFGSTYYFNLTDIGDRGASEIASDVKTYEKAIKSTTDQVKDEQTKLQDALKSGDITREQYAERLADSAIKKSYANLSSDFKENAPDIDEAKKELVKFLSDNGFEKVDYESLYTKQFEMYLDTIEQQMLDEKTKELDKALADKKITLDEYNKALEEFKKNNNLTRWGWEAYRAGQEARSFNDVLNTLKDTISRGWATSFEYIFGRLDEAKDFFTWLTESDLANAIYSIGEFRNEVLKNWKEQGGRDALIEALETLDQLLGRILGRFSIFNSDSEDFEYNTSALAQRLTQATKNFRDFTKRLDAWFTDDRVERIHRIFEVISALTSTIKRAFMIALNFGLNLFSTIAPILEKVLDNIEKVVLTVDGLFNARDAKAADGLNSIKTGLDNILIVVQPLIEPLGKVIDILGDIVSFFAELAVGTFTSNIDFFTDTLEFLIAILGGKPASGSSTILESLSDGVKMLGNACSKAFGFVSGFFSNLYEDLLILFGFKDHAPDSKGGYFENLSKYFDSNQFLTDVKKWFEKIPEEITKLWNMVDEFLFGKKVKIKKPNQKTETTVRIKQGFSKWIDTAIKDVKKWITKDLPKKISEIWNTIEDFFFSKKIKIKKPNQQTETTIHIKQSFSEWLSNTINEIKKWILDLPATIRDLWDKIIDTIFYTDADPNAINPETNEKFGPGVRIKNGFLQWIEALPGKIWTWITTDLPNIVKDIWNNVIDFIIGPKVDEKLIGTPIPGTNKKYGPNDRVLTGFATWISNLPSNIWTWITTKLPGIVTKIWNNVIGFIVGPKVDEKDIGTVAEDGHTIVADERVKTGFALWIENIAKDVVNWASNWHDNVKKIWNTVLDAVFGNGIVENKDFNQNVYDNILKNGGFDAAERYKKSTEKPILTKVTDFIKNLGIDIGKIISDLPKYVVEGWNFSLDLFSSLIEHLTGWFENKNNVSEVIADETGAAAQEAAEEISGDQNDSTFLGAVLKLGGNIARIFQDTLPKFFTEAWDYISNPVNSGSLLDSVTALLDINPTDIDTAIRNAGDMISDNIRKLPNYIRTAFDTIKNLFDPRQQEFASVRKNLEDQFKKGLISQDDFERYSKYAEQSILHGPKKQSPLIEAIKSIFGATGDFVKEIGPDILNGLNSLFDWLGEQLTKVTNFLNNRDKNEDITTSITKAVGADEDVGEGSPLAQALTKLGTTIATLITDILPKFIISAFEEVKLLIPKMIEGLGDVFSGDGLLGGLFGSAGAEGAEETTGDGSENVSRMVKDAVENEKDAAEDALSEEEALANEIAKRKILVAELIEKANKDINAHSFMEMATGEIIAKQGHEALFDKAKSELELYTSYQETLNNFEGTMADLDAKVPIGKLEESAEAQKDFFGTFSDILLVISSSSPAITNAAVIIAIAGVINNLIETLGQTVSVTDELKAAAKLAMWSTIKVAIIGFIGIMAWVMTLASTDVEAFNRVSGVLDKFISLLEKIAGVVEFVAAFKYGSNAVGDISGFLSNIVDLKKLKKEGLEGTLKDDIGELTDDKDGSLLSLVGALVEKGGGAFLGGLAISSISDMLGSGIAGLFDGIAEAVSSIGVAFGNFMSILKPTLDKINELKEPLETAIEVVPNITTLLSTFYEAIVNMGYMLTNTTEEAYGPGGQPLFSHKITITEFDEEVTKALDAVIYFVGKYTDIANNVLQVVKTVGEIDDIYLRVSQLKTLFGTDNGKYTEFFTLMTEDIPNLMSKMANTFLNGTDFTVFNSGLGYAGNAADYLSFFSSLISVVSSSITSFDLDSAQSMQVAFGALSDLLTSLDEAGFTEKAGTLSRLIVQSIDLGQLGRLLAVFGVNLRDFFDRMKEIRDIVGTGKDDTEDATAAFETIMRLSMTALSGVAKIINQLNPFYEDNLSDNAAQVIGKLFSSLGSGNVNALGGLVKSYGEGAAGFFEAFHNLRVKLGVTKFSKDDLDFFTDSIGLFKSVIETVKLLETIDKDQFFTEDSKLIQLQQKIDRFFKFILMGQDVKKINQKSGNTYIGFLEYFGYFLESMYIVMENVRKNIFLNSGNTATIEAITQTAGRALDALNTFMEIFGNFKDDKDNKYEAIEDNVGDFMNLLDTFASNKSKIDSFLDMAKDLDTVGLSNAASFATTMHAIADMLVLFADFDLSNAENVFQGWSYQTGLNNLLNMNWADIGSVAEKVTEIFADDALTNNMYIFGSNLIIGLTNGITDHISGAVSAMEEVATQLSRTFTIKMEIKSPSHLFERYGKNLDEGLGIGIDENSNLPAEAIGRTAEEIIAQYQAILDDPNATKQDKDMAKRMLDSLFLDPKHLLGAKQQVKQNAEELKTTVEEANDAVISAVSEEGFKKLTTKKMSLFEMVLNVVAPWGEFHNNALHAAAEGPAKRIAYYLGNAIGNSVAKHKDDAESGLLSSIVNSKLFEVLMTGVIPEFGTSMFAKLLRTIHNPDDLSPEANDVFDKYADFKWGDVSTYIANAYLKDVFPNVFAALNAHGGFDFTADNFDFKKALFPFINGLLADISEMSDDEETKKICSVFGNFISKIFDVGLNDEGDWSFKTAKQNIHDNMGEFIGFVYSELNNFTDDPRVKNAFGFGKMFANLFTGKGIFGDNNPFDSMLGETSAVTESMNNEFANFGSSILNMFGGLSDLPEDSLDLSPKITPVLEITDDFEAQAERANSLLDFNNGSIGGGGGSLNMPNTSLDLASQIEIPQPIDYTSNLNQIQTGIEYLQQGINSVGSSLSSMRFIIQGKEMVWTIGPDMMEYIGYEQTAGPGRYNS